LKGKFWLEPIIHTWVYQPLVKLGQFKFVQVLRDRLFNFRVGDAPLAKSRWRLALLIAGVVGFSLGLVLTHTPGLAATTEGGWGHSSTLISGDSESTAKLTANLSSDVSSEWLADQSTDAQSAQAFTIAQAVTQKPDLVAVTEAAPGATQLDTEAKGTAAQPAQPAKLKVLTKTFPPFVSEEDGVFRGFSVELWSAIANEIGVTFEWSSTKTLDNLIKTVEDQDVDLAIAGVSMTQARESLINFSHPFFQSGLQILIPKASTNPIIVIVNGVWQLLTTPQLYYAIGVFICTLLTAAHIIWLLERRHNPDFIHTYPRGVWDAFWWAAVTVTTVGYGDKTPRSLFGRAFALVWMCSGYFVFAYFIATVTTSFTVEQLTSQISDPTDLRGRAVATVRDSTAQSYLVKHDVRPTTFATAEEMYAALQSGEIEAIVYDAPVLQHYILHAAKDRFELTGDVFNAQEYGIVLPNDSPYREVINQTILTLRENGVYDELYQRWFGGNDA